MVETNVFSKNGFEGDRSVVGLPASGGSFSHGGWMCCERFLPSVGAGRERRDPAKVCYDPAPAKFGGAIV
jgi:hypothetical protein